VVQAERPPAVCGGHPNLEVKGKDFSSRDSFNAVVGQGWTDGLVRDEALVMMLRTEAQRPRYEIGLTIIDWAVLAVILPIAGWSHRTYRPTT
jgi:hypothetical protein